MEQEGKFGGSTHRKADRAATISVANTREGREVQVTASVPLAALRCHADGWLLDGELRRHSPRTVENRRLVLNQLLRYLHEGERDGCGKPELQGFFLSLTREGRKPGTVVSYFNILRTFWAFVVEEGGAETNPFDRWKPPIDRQDDITPFTEEQVQALLRAAKGAGQAERDTAIVMLLLDTGMRASELCGVHYRDLDLSARSIRVENGKGGKSRSVYYGGRTRKVLNRYLLSHPRGEGEPLFVAYRGTKAGDPLTRSGLLQLITRLGEAAGVSGVRCSPHTFRHTFAITFLRRGGNQFALMRLLGHTDLTMTSKYVRLAEADLAEQGTKFSPADGLNL